MSIDRLIPADEALGIVLESARPGVTEETPLLQAAGRILAEDLVSLRTQPPFDASAMDGYAVRASDVSSTPATLKTIGESRAGMPFEGSLQAGEAVRVFTGAVVPENADTIIIQENTTARDGDVEIHEASPAGKFIRKAGLDFGKGETLLRQGDMLTASRIALAASMNHATLKTHVQPRVGIIATGDELVQPGEATGPGQIIASNTFGIHSMVTDCGGEAVNLGIVADEVAALTSTFEQAISDDIDIILTTGGASVGDHDLVKPVAEQLGFRFEIAKIAMRPGKPFLFARREMSGRTVFLVGLAGNPVSSLVAFNVFAKPLIRRLAGFPDHAAHPVSAILGRDLGPNDERMEYMRATLETNQDGTRIVTPFDKQDSSMLATFVRAQCLLVRPANAKASPKGEACKIIMLD
jgi:molybdopterin molybdotransferase